MTSLGPLAVLVAIIALAVRMPQAWAAGGWVPDVALLATLYVGIRGTPERGAWFGIAAGVALSPFTAEPFLMRAFVLGTCGFLGGRAAGVIARDRPETAVAIAAAASLLARSLAEIPLAGSGSAPSRVLPAVAVTALAAPLVFAIVRRTALLAPLERSFRDV